MLRCKTRHSYLLAQYALFLIIAVLSGIAVGHAREGVTLQLACELSYEDEHQAAALEFRRLALSAELPARRAVYLWAAAYEYTRTNIWSVSEKMLLSAENYDPQIEPPALLLRGENAAAQRLWAEADFYFQCLRDNPHAGADMRRYAARQNASALAALRRANEAYGVLQAAPGDNTDGQTALLEYQRGHDKKPWLGGLLGIVPGLGYLYAGEYANATRSMLLNSLFIFGMLSTAEHDQWGAFAVITFLEFTWYSGSIYGGMDAAHRYNRQRLDHCQEQIIGAANYKPDWQKLPLLVLRFEF